MVPPWVPPEREILYTTDPDRISVLAREHGSGVERAPVRAAVGGADREETVVALARETFAFQEADGLRLDCFVGASRRFRSRVLAGNVSELPLREAHRRMVALAEECPPTRVGEEEE